MAVTRQGSTSSSDSTNALAHTIAAGTNRVLIVGVTQELAGVTQLDVAYGGQAMTPIVGINVGDATDQRVDLYFLNDAGIASAADNQIDVTSPPASYSILAQTYAGALQTTPTVVDSEALTGDSDPLVNIQISAAADEAVIGIAGSGNLSTGVTWAGTNPLTNLVNIEINGTAHGTMADRLVTGTETVNHNLTFTTAPNRVAGAAFLLESDAGAANPSITDFGDEEHDDLETGVIITGADFEAVQATGFVEISDNATYATGTKVGQTETSWGDTSITVTIDMGALTPGNPRWLWVTNDNGDRNAVGFQFHLHRARQFEMVGSANITAGGGQNTTQQLSLPATKAGGDFDGGKITDDTNPSGTVDPTDGGFIEDEICLQATTNSDFSSQSQFRVLRGGVVLDTYTVDPRCTISAAGPPQEVLHEAKLQNSVLLGHLHR